MAIDITDGTPVISVLQEARQTADWDLVESVYRQCAHIVSDDGDPDNTYLPDALPSHLAELLGRIASSYIGAEERLAWHALAVFANADTDPHEAFGSKEFRALYWDDRFCRFASYSPQVAQQFHKRRRPRPFETIVETCRRLRDANAIEATFRNGSLDCAGILGGSLSYGRFYNVCGGGVGEASDLDVVVVIKEPGQLLELAERIGGVPGAHEADRESFRHRAEYFLDSRLHDGRTVFSHKLRMWSAGSDADPLMRWASVSVEYLISLHVLTVPTLDYLLVADSTKLKGDTAGVKRSLLDYREKSAARVDHQRSFGGRDHRTALEVHETEGGYLRRSRVYVIDSADQYYPGMFQNLIAPRFDIRWDGLGVKTKLDVFKWKLFERLEYERRIRPHEFLRLSLAHTRSEVFAPHIARNIDQDAVTG